MDTRADLEYCTRYRRRVAGLRIDIEKLAYAALDEVMPWRALIFAAGTFAAQTRATGHTLGIARASSFHDGKAVAGNCALPYHLALH